MGFIEAKCRNCGGDIRLDDELTRGKCEYCGTAFVKSDMIVNNNYTIQNANLVIDDDKIFEQMLVNAETYLTTLKDYDKAFSTYCAAAENKANDYRGWWGMLRAASHDFTLTIGSRQDYEKMCQYADHAIKLLPHQNKSAFTNQWEEYKQKIEEYISSKDRKFAEWVEKLKNRQAKANRNRMIRRIAANGISIAAGLFIVLFGLFHYAPDITTNILIYVGAALATNTLLTILLQFVGRAPECFIYQAITTLSVAVYLCYRLTVDTMYISNLFHLLMFGVLGLFIAAVCIIPTALVCKFLFKRKRHS